MDIDGTNDPDTLNGTSGSDVIRGLGGNDRLDGGGGQDIVYGGDGDDEITDVSGGNDSLFGEAGNDLLTVDVGAFMVDGGAGDDVITIRPNASAAFAVGGLGDDQFYIHTQFDQRLTGGEGQDYFWFKKGLRSTITDFQAGPGGDRLDMATYIDEITGWDGVGDPFELGYAALTGSDDGTILWFDRDGGADTLVPYLFLPGTDPTAFTSANFVGISPTLVVAGPPVDGLLQGGIRNDLFPGGAGAHVEAGLGEDKITYQGVRADYRIAYGNGSWYVLDAAPGGGLTVVDRLDELERVRFGDGELQLMPTATQATIAKGDFAQTGTVVAIPGGGFMLVWSGEDSAHPGVGGVLFQFYDSAGTAVGAVHNAFDSPSWSYSSDAAFLPDGGFVIVGNRIDGGGDGLIGRVFDADGTPRGAEFGVNSSTAGNERRGDIAVLAGGGFVVAWSSDIGVATGQLFDSQGQKVGGEFFIGGLSDPANGDVVVAPLADGGFAAFWIVGPDAYVRRFGADGQSAGDSHKVSATTLPGFAGLDSALLPDGRVMLTWEDGYKVWARAFDPATDSLGPIISVNVTSSGTVPSIAVFDDGSFVIAWEQSLATRKTLAQRFDNAGERVGGEFTISRGEMQPAPKVAALADGSFVAVYQDGSFSPVATAGVGVAIMGPPTVFDHGVVTDASGGLSAQAGTDAADLLAGGAGDDVIDGRGGDDRLVAGQSGRDVVLGGAGSDRLVLDWTAAGSAVSLAGNLAASAGGGYEGIFTTAAGDRVEFRGIESFELHGGTAADTLAAGAGNDLLDGGGGNDLLLLDRGGVDTASGGGGSDVLYFGAAFTGADVADGGEGRDVVVLQGNYALTLSATNLTGVESLSLQSGSRTTWGDVANNFYDYAITTNDANVAAGQQLIVNGQTLRAGEDFTFDGSAETDGYFLVYGGHGVDTLKGGAGNDAFFFEGVRWGAGDTVDGGAGRDALIISSGSGVNHFDFGANALTGIESISLNNRYTTDPSQKPSYELVLSNGNVAPGATLIVNGSSLADRAQTVSVDGSAVHDGSLILFGGFGNDTLKGGDGADLFQGGEGVDVLTGGGGADTFRYAGPYDSTSQLPDRILDFASGVDKIDLTRIDADLFAAGDQAFHWIGSNAFTGGGAASAGELRAYDFNGSWYVEGDMDGNGSADLVIQLTTPVAPVVQGDFLL